jgi:hypothetical protein
LVNVASRLARCPVSSPSGPTGGEGIVGTAGGTTVAGGAGAEFVVGAVGSVTGELTSVDDRTGTLVCSLEHDVVIATIEAIAASSRFRRERRGRGNVVSI